jgi:uncharacterized protein
MNNDLMKAVLGGYLLRWDGTHGLPHWGRVLETGTRLAQKTGADPEVVRYFALFHDCRRTNEGFDPGHGLRGAEVARSLLGKCLDLRDDQFEQLHYACEYHTDGLTEADVTIQTCWDADRLDLGRVWITPEPRFLCTPAAKDVATMEWADERARNGHTPAVVKEWLTTLA